MPKPDRLLTTLLIAIATMAPPLVATPDWHVKDATFRLVVKENWKQKNTVLVRLPQEFSHWKHAVAYLGNGHQVGCRSLIMNNAMQAVEVAVSNSQMAAVNLKELYIYPTDKPRTPRPVMGNPVSCYYTGKPFVARPADGREMLQYIKSHPAPPFYRTLPGFPVKTYGIHLFYKLRRSQNIRTSNFRSLKVRAQLSTNIISSTAQTVEFAIENNDAGPWYLFINNDPVFSWGNAVVEDQEPVRSRPVKLAAGLNTLDFFVFPDQSELFPVLTIKTEKDPSFKKVPRSMMLSPNDCTSYQIEHRKQGVVCNFSLTRSRGRYYRESGKTSFPLVIDRSQMEPVTTFTLNGRPLTFNGGQATGFLTEDDGILVLNLAESAPIRTLTIPVVPAYFRIDEEILKFRLTECPLFEPIEDDLTLTYTLSRNHGKGRVTSSKTLSLTYFADDDTVITSVRTPVPASPFKRRITIDRSVEGVAYVEASVHLRGVRASNAIRIYLVSPDDPARFVEKGGNLLHYGDGLAVLKRQRGTITVPDITTSPQSSRTIAFVDSFVANVQHPYDSPPRFTELPSLMSFQHLPVVPSAGDQPTVNSLLCAVGQAVHSDTSGVVVSLPFDVIRTMDFRDQRELVMFLTKLVRGAGKDVAFISFPAEGTLPRNKIRDFALMLKESGRSFDLPVIDLYSASLRQSDVSHYWEAPTSGGSPIRTAVPNAQGQLWILSEIDDALGGGR